MCSFNVSGEFVNVASITARLKRPRKVRSDIFCVLERFAPALNLLLLADAHGQERLWYTASGVLGNARRCYFGEEGAGAPGTENFTSSADNVSPVGVA
jgi:hypothetical protein